MKVTLDENRIAHIDGKRFFLIGARHMPVGATPELLRDAGFNAFRTLAFGHEAAEAEVALSHIEGIYFWSYIFDRADFTKSPDHETQLRKRIAELRDHPALLCYENYNEPTMNYHSDSFKTQPEDLARGTGILRELDPDHPVWLAHTCTHTVETLRRFNACADITGCNPYPLYVPGMRSHIGVRPDGKMLDAPDQSVHAVGRYTEKMMNVAGDGMPVWMLIQALANEHWFNPKHNPEFEGQTVDESKVLYPTFDQMRFMAFDAIIAGATGLALSMARTPTEGDIWRDIKRLVAELRTLHDALCAPPVPEPVNVSYVDLGYTIWDGVRTLVRRNGNTLHVFAANTAFDPAQVVLRHPSLPPSGAAFVVGEDREVAIDHSTLTDRFDPYGVHVYRIAASQ